MRTDILDWRGANVLSEGGEKIGTLEEVYLDHETDEPEFALVNTGLLGARKSLVPVAEASRDADGIRVPYDKDTVKNAPSVEADGDISQAEEEELYRYYGRAYSPDGDTDVDTVGRDTSGPTTDDAMTRSEEELRVGKTSSERGRVRLKKYVVSENVTERVPLRHEEAHIEREPITEGNIDAANAGPAISDEEHEVVLHEEQAVVEKRAVPKERVRLAKDEVTEERRVSEELRKEQIEQEGDISR